MARQREASHGRAGGRQAPGEVGGPPLTSLEGLSAMRAAVIFLAVVVAGCLVRIFQELLAPLVVAVFLTLLIN